MTSPDQQQHGEHSQGGGVLDEAGDVAGAPVVLVQTRARSSPWTQQVLEAVMVTVHGS